MRERLRSWLAAQLPDAENVEVFNLDARRPPGTERDGAVRRVVDRGGSPHHESLVLRTAPSGHTVFPTYDLAEQFDVMTCAAAAVSPGAVATTALPRVGPRRPGGSSS